MITHRILRDPAPQVPVQELFAHSNPAGRFARAACCRTTSRGVGWCNKLLGLNPRDGAVPVSRSSIPNILPELLVVL